MLLTADWVLQSCPAMVRSSLKVSLLMTSTLQVSDRPRAQMRPLKGLLVPTLTTILVSLQWTETEEKHDFTILILHTQQLPSQQVPRQSQLTLSSVPVSMLLSEMSLPPPPPPRPPMPPVGKPRSIPPLLPSVMPLDPVKDPPGLIVVSKSPGRDPRISLSTQKI